MVKMGGGAEIVGEPERLTAPQGLLLIIALYERRLGRHLRAPMLHEIVR